MKKNTFRTMAILILPICPIVIVGIGGNRLPDATTTFFSPVGVSGSDFCYPEAGDHQTIGGNIIIYRSWSAIRWWREGANVKVVRFVAITGDGKRHAMYDRVGDVYYWPDGGYDLFTAMATVPDLKATEKIVKMEATIHVQGAGNLKFTTPVPMGSCNQ